MSLSDQILTAQTFNYGLNIPLNDLKSLTNCWVDNFDPNSEFLKLCLSGNFDDAAAATAAKRVKRDENLMKKIVDAYSDVFGSHSKAQKK